jgi:hypothetical protein
MASGVGGLLPVGVTVQQVGRFSALFDGLNIAFGTGKGEWIKRAPTFHTWRMHLDGEGPGMGIAPLRPDNTVMFAAIDLDEPDFDAAREMQKYLPGPTWIERSRSGNAHVWAFFSEPIEAWVPMGVMKEACLAADKPGVEVFPKNHDFARVRLGNYINLPYHGDQRPIMREEPDYEGESEHWHPDLQAAADRRARFFDLDEFLEVAEASKNDPAEWRKKARYLLINAPEDREQRSEFGQQKRLHKCADYIISGEAGPITEGHRNAVFFMLARCLSNWQDCSHDEALELMRGVNEDLCKPMEQDSELRRILGNVERAGYTSTGCDDPLVLPFTHPDCRIAHPRR